MAALRAHQLAKELGLDSKSFLVVAEKAGIAIKSHMSSLDEKTAQKLRTLHANGKLLLPPTPKEKAETEQATKAEEAPKSPAVRAKSKASPVKAKKTVTATSKKSVATPPKKAAAPAARSGVSPAVAKTKPEPVKAPPKKVKQPKETVQKQKEGLKELEALERELEDLLVKKPPPDQKKPASPPEDEKEDEKVAEAVTAEVIAPEIASEPEEFLGAPPSDKKVRITEAQTVKELAELLEVPAAEVIKHLMGVGILSTMNQIIDIDAAVSVVQKFGREAEVVEAGSEELLFEEEEEGGDHVVPRAPVVTVMGHVDHGKTRLLDAIRKTNVIEREAGGITQHIGAYHVTVGKGTIVFLDTPGHEAFTAMRARGAQVTDIVVLVVAADSGVMPQTREAIAHARAAGVPIVVAINKVDLPNANPDKVKQDLTEFKLVPEEWGGDTIMVEVSAKQQQGIEDLLEMILLQTEILELKANPKLRSKGVVIESSMDRGRGPVATVLVQKGTLQVGDPFLAGLHHGKVRALMDGQGKKVESAGPSMPIVVLGFSGVPQAGDSFVVVQDERKARQIGALRLKRQHEEELAKSARTSLEDFLEGVQKGVAKELPIVLKTDTRGSSQALQEALQKLSTEEVKLRFIHEAVGGISESDVMLASTSRAVIIGFHVRPTPQASALAQQERVDIRLYSIIYEVLNDIKAAMEGLLDPTYREVVLGRAEVRQIFTIPKIGVVAGCHVTEGLVQRTADARLLRDDVVVFEGKIGSLRRFKEDVSEVSGGFECGITLDQFQDVKPGDIIEPYVMQEEERKGQ